MDFRLLFLAVLLSALPNLCDAARPNLLAKALKQAPILDGEVLNDPVWKTTTTASGFRTVRPVEGELASQRTQVSVAFTDNALYVAVICFRQ